MKRQWLTESPESKWTRPEDYLGAMARKRTFRRGRRMHDRTEPESPQLLLSTIPFLALICLLGVLAVAIMFIVLARRHTQPRAAPVAQKELFIAPKLCFQKAQREFHH